MTYRVIYKLINDEENYFHSKWRVSSRIFDTYEAAKKYASGVAPSREPKVYMEAD